MEHAHFELISKILYKAKADETWGEYECNNELIINSGLSIFFEIKWN